MLPYNARIKFRMTDFIVKIEFVVNRMQKVCVCQWIACICV